MTLHRDQTLADPVVTTEPLTAQPPPPIRAPLAEALRRLLAGPEVASFHALPWTDGQVLDTSGVGERYAELFGRSFLRLDRCYGGAALDSFFQPRGPLDQAQRLAATAFGADYTFFLTGGTTLANRIALHALAPRRARVLIDPNAPAALHAAAAEQPGWAVDEVPLLATAGSAGTRPPDLAALCALLRAADADHRPYDVVVLAASADDGVLYRMDRILPAVAAASPLSALVVDEAWTAVHSFHPHLRRHATLPAAQRLAARCRATGQRAPTVLVSQAADKTLCAARQTAYLHVVGDSSQVRQVQRAVFHQHTPSPSWPLLVSLDLARAHAEECGRRELDRVLALADQVRAALAGDPLLREFRAPEGPTDEAEPYCLADPLRIAIAVPDRIGGKVLWETLFRDYGVYLGRGTEQSLRLSFHLGVTAEHVRRLLAALRSVARRWPARSEPDAVPTVPDHVEDFVIPYPPGVPTAVPG